MRNGLLPRGVAMCTLYVCTAASVLAQTSSGMAEMTMADQLAGAAAHAQDLQRVKADLQQALNCLVGRDGREYQPAVGDPCRGAGALQKLPSGSVNSIRVRKAISLASVGVTFHDFRPAHYTALAVQAVLDEGIDR